MPPAWNEMHPLEKLERLFEQQQSIERLVRANDATLRHLHERLRWLEEKVTKSGA